MILRVLNVNQPCQTFAIVFIFLYKLFKWQILFCISLMAGNVILIEHFTMQLNLILVYVNYSF